MKKVTKLVAICRGYCYNLLYWRKKGALDLFGFVLATAAFTLFVGYDKLQLQSGKPFSGALFFLGTILLAMGTGLLFLPACAGVTFLSLRFIGFSALALISLILLIYSLFFALPAADTYLGGGNLRPVVRRGVYALCRHPGVLWLSFFYLFLWLSVGGWTLFSAWLYFSALDLLYAYWQDRRLFPRLFSDYEEYRLFAPFFLPTPASIRQCFASLRH